MVGRASLAGIAVGGLAVGLLTAGPSAAAQGSAAQRTIKITSATPVASYPHLKVTTRTRNPEPGYLFAGPKFDGPRPAGAPVGPLIVDDHGRPVYFRNTSDGVRATDVRVQTYKGQRVLTYWKGTTGIRPGIGVGDDYIVDEHYNVIRKVHGHGSGCQADQHEFLLTPGDTAIIVCYELTQADATAAGGAANQEVLDGVVQEINLATANVVFEWHSVGHVPLTDSYTPAPSSAGTPWDYFHINSVRVDADHALIISARHTWTVYKVARHTGDVIWQLGGKHSSFTIGKGAAFSWQHDAEPLGNHYYRIFDNAWDQDPATKSTHPQSRVLTIKLDPHASTATGVGKLMYPASTLLAGSQGNAEQLRDNHLLVDWGAANRITEFNAHGQMIFDSHLPSRYDSYRAYKYRWAGTPATHPSMQTNSPSGVKQIDAVWNGATTVARWGVYGGPRPDRLRRVASIAWNGYDTAFRLASWPAYMQLAAIDSHGNNIAWTGIHHVG